MILAHWLGRLASGLYKLAKRGGAGVRRGSRPRRRSRSYSHVAAIETREPRRLLSAVTEGDDSFQMQASRTEVQSFEWDLLVNDSSAAGGLMITSVQS